MLQDASLTDDQQKDRERNGHTMLSMYLNTSVNRTLKHRLTKLNLNFVNLFTAVTDCPHHRCSLPSFLSMTASLPKRLT